MRERFQFLFKPEMAYPTQEVEDLEHLDLDSLVLEIHPMEKDIGDPDDEPSLSFEISNANSSGNEWPAGLVMCFSKEQVMYMIGIMQNFVKQNYKKADEPA